MGITNDLGNRTLFENRLITELQKSDVNAIKSLDFFENSYTKFPKTEEELMILQSELITAGVDVILLSKVVRVSEKVTVMQATRNLERNFRNFREDYYDSQAIFNTSDNTETYQIFHAESSLYCICPEKETELIWKGSIDVIAPENTKKAVGDYIKVLLWALREQQLLIIQPRNNESLNL